MVWLSLGVCWYEGVQVRGVHNSIVRNHGWQQLANASRKGGAPRSCMRDRVGATAAIGSIGSLFMFMMGGRLMVELDLLLSFFFFSRFLYLFPSPYTLCSVPLFIIPILFPS